MKRFKKILVYVDEKGRKCAAVRRAIPLAAHTGASVELLSVLDDSGWASFLESAQVKAFKLEEGHRAKDALADISREMKRKGVKKVSNRVRWGSAGSEILQEIARNRIDLVMKTAQGSDGNRMIGVVGRKLMRKARCPVWMVKPKFSRRYKKMLAAIDPVPGDDDRNELNRKILDYAVSLAEFEKADLHVVSAARGVPKVKQKTFTSNQVNQWKRLRELQREFFHNMVEPFGLLENKKRLHLLQGEPADVIRKLVLKEGIELIAMGTVARSGLDGFFIGNTAERVLDEVNCSVLALKPDGFGT